MTAILATAFPALASYGAARSSDNAPWDVLIFTIIVLAIILVPAGLAAILNSRDDRRGRYR